jgi:hypothetical protein
MRSIELSRSAACVFPHQRLVPLRRVASRTIGELLTTAEADLAAAADALVFPERPLAMGLGCAACGATSDLVKRCEAVGDAEVRCVCRAPGAMGPIEVGNRLDGDRLRALASQPWRALGIPPEDLVTVCSGPARAHYLLPRNEARNEAAVTT